MSYISRASQVTTSGKEPTCQFRRHKRHGFNLWVQKIPWRRAWQPTPVFLPGESHGQWSLVGYSPRGGKESYYLHGLNRLNTRAVYLYVLPWNDILLFCLLCFGRKKGKNKCIMFVPKELRYSLPFCDFIFLLYCGHVIKVEQIWSHKNEKHMLRIVEWINRRCLQPRWHCGGILLVLDCFQASFKVRKLC